MALVYIPCLNFRISMSACGAALYSRVRKIL